MLLITCPNCGNSQKFKEKMFPARFPCNICETALVVEADVKIDKAIETHEALKRLTNWRPECGFPANAKLAYEKFHDDPKKERKNLNGMRFFTESFLYELLGKDDARSILGRLDKLCRLLGFQGLAEIQREGDE